MNLEWDPPETDAAQETPIFGLPATSQMRAGQNFFEGFSEDMETLKEWGDSWRHPRSLAAGCCQKAENWLCRFVLDFQRHQHSTMLDRS